jgi:hypothetical protein
MWPARGTWKFNPPIDSALHKLSRGIKFVQNRVVELIL